MIKICVKKDAKEAEKSASYIIPRKMNFVEIVFTIVTGFQ